MAELEDEKLYNQGLERPEDYFCPICTLPIPLPMDEHSVFNACCMKRVCKGCVCAVEKRGMRGCPFCRTPHPYNDSDTLVMLLARVEKKDPDAISNLGMKYLFGDLGLQKDARRAVELWTEAAELGWIGALCSLGNAYYLGDGVQKDEAKAIQFWRKVAMQGHVEGRNNLGSYEWVEGSHDRAVRHFLISAKMGNNVSVENIKKMFSMGNATKEQYAEALKGYQHAVEEMKSHDRDEAKRLGF